MKKLVNFPPRIIAAAKKAEITRAEYERVYGIYKSSKREELAANDYRKEESPDERITDTRDDYLMGDADFEAYCKGVYARSVAKGLDTGGWDINCWSWHKAALDAEDALIDEIAKDFPPKDALTIIHMKHNDKYRAKMLAVLGL